MFVSGPITRDDSCAGDRQKANLVLMASVIGLVCVNCGGC